MFGYDGQSPTKPYEAEPVQKFRLCYWSWRYLLPSIALLMALGVASVIVARRAQSAALGVELLLVLALVSLRLRERHAIEVGFIVGIDGVCVRGRPIPHEQIASLSHTVAERRVHKDESGFRVAVRWILQLMLANGESVPISNHTSFGPLNDARAEPMDEPGRALLRVIETARSEWRRAPRAPSALGSEIWASTYGDGVERLLFSPRAKWLSRAAAAILFAQHDTSYARVRLEHVASTTANPAFRRLLRQLRASRGQAKVAAALIAIANQSRDEGRARPLAVRIIESKYFILVALSISAIGAATLLYVGSGPGAG
jgi:hypothetical protein